MIQNSFSQESEAAAGRYLLLVNGWRGAYSGAFHGGDLSSPRQVSQLRADGYTLARTYLAGETSQIERATAEVAKCAHQSALAHLGIERAPDPSSRTSALLGALSEHLESETRVQIERDVAFMVQSLRRAALQIHTAARAQGISERAAMIQYRIVNDGELRFYFQDRQNRKWPSQKFIRSAWRGHLLGTYNDIYLATAADHGVTTFEVEHPSDSQHAGKRFSVLHNTALPHYGELRDQVFHPNSDAIARIAA